MTRFFLLIAIIFTLSACSKSPSEEIISDNIIVDSSEVVYNAAFKICSLKYEVQQAELSWVVLNFFLKDTLKAKTAQSEKDRLELSHKNSIDEFIELTHFGSRDIWHLEAYTNFIRIQYLQTHLPNNYFADHKTEILSISREGNSNEQEFKNPFDSTQYFMLSNLTIKVLDEIGIDSSVIGYNTLKNINILVQSFGDFIDPDFFPCFIQNKENNCGPACLKTIADHYNVYYSLSEIERLVGADTSGKSFLQLTIAAEKMGFDTKYKRTSVEELQEVELPVIVHWNGNHFVVLYEITDEKVKIADPLSGDSHISYQTFCDHWLIEDGKAVTIGNILEIRPN